MNQPKISLIWKKMEISGNSLRYPYFLIKFVKCEVKKLQLSRRIIIFNKQNKIRLIFLLRFFKNRKSIS